MSSNVAILFELLFSGGLLLYLVRELSSTRRALREDKEKAAAAAAEPAKTTGTPPGS